MMYDNYSSYRPALFFTIKNTTCQVFANQVTFLIHALHVEINTNIHVPAVSGAFFPATKYGAST